MGHETNPVNRMPGLIFFAGLIHFVQVYSNINTSQQNFQPDLELELRLHCFIQHGSRQEECSFSNEYTDECYSKLPVSGNEGSWNGRPYSNISVHFHPQDLMDFRFVHIVTITTNGHERILFQIDLSIPASQYPSFTLSVVYIPSKLQRLFVRRIVPLHKCFHTSQDPCGSPEAVKMCGTLTTTSKIMLKPKVTSVEISLIPPWLDSLKIELYGRRCKASCDDLNPPCETSLTTLLWSSPMNELIIDNLKPANYCAKAIYSVEGHACCSIFTRTWPILGGVAKYHLHSPHNFHVSVFFYYLFVALAIIIVVALFVHYRSRRKIVRTLSQRVHKDDENSQMPLTPRGELEPSDIETFLVYPRKTIQFMDAMSTFRKLLGEYAKKVWDPFDAHETDNVIANPARWMQNVLSIPNLKILLVETEEALTWFQNDDRTVDIEDQDLYVSVLSFILNHPKLLYDYRRLLVVRFDKINIGDMQLNMVPQKRYKMPYQLGLLIKDLMDWHEDPIGTESSFPALQRFCKATEDYQSSSGQIANIEFNRESEML